MERVLGQHKSANIFLLGSPRDRRVLGEWMRLAEHNGSRVSMVNDLDVFLQRPLSYFRCDDVDLIELREEPLQNPVNRLVKRGVDLLISFPVVVIVLPVLMGVVWILHRWQAPGPLIFRQVRSGIDNEPFTILKFRTMYDGKGGDGGQARKHDDRVFPAGRWLRRFSLDEFPQFFNVLTGQMSVVGPRPHMVGHDEVFAESMSGYAVRGFVKPGITGLAQIRGLRGETVTPEDIVNRVQSDIEYIENWSVMLDVRILWQTSLQLVRPPKSAY
jgi:lipopolysaccharide/colanic/teichoic acid biosynthesis glycosyltransferase